ncbi:two-component system heavy metal sensor histidine kinase CusS [Roseimicrobium gellanilyticum]|uniref:histidine kinase n=1 Tax=Roseimicrobium gellanilyticum TaxID=748857 RepID=A0A366HX74_9BACT|nr:heavy metal sensor histidine kinase [Roseimicrobium gellanilyticum]RBP48164.1 two-component system heavy metal sensor histidine kinase CusS [Roseimicrobium gellanilyticum]
MPDPPAPSSRPKRAIGLTTRLVAGYMLVALITTTAGAIFLYHGLHESYAEEDTEFLNTHIKSLREELAKRPTPPMTKDMIVNSYSHRNMEAQYGQISTRRGQVMMQSPGFTDIVPDVTAFPPPVSEHEDIKEARYYRKSPTSPLMMLTSAMVRREQTDALFIYRVALDVSHIEGWMAEFRNQLIGVVLAGTTLSGLLAWVLTRQGLRPLQDITAAMRRVGASGLDGRLGHNPWPKELAATADEFDLMLERLRDSFMRLSRFSADAAHEFRTPLNSLMISTSLMLSHDRDSEEYRQALTANLEQYERLKSMVDSLLFIARADNAETVLTKSDINMVTLGTEVLDFFSALAEDRGITTEVIGNGTAYGDATLLRLAISNLVSNALRHTAAGGRVSITVEESADTCSIEVSDTGVGIAPEHLPRLFDRFYRVDAARTADDGEKGVGLGLPLVKTIAQLHGGLVTASSTPGKGTTMRLTVPRALRVEA